MKCWTVADVMRRDVVTVHPDTGFHEVADVLVRRGVSAVPVVDRDGTVLGVVSEADLLGKLEYADRIPHHPLAARRVRNRRGRAPGDTAGELMSAPAITVRPTATVSRAARLIDAARVKRLPVVDESGQLVGIVSRRDLVRLYTRPDGELRGDVQADLRDLGIDPDLVTVIVDRGIVTLRGAVDRRSIAAIAIDLVAAIPGVVDAVSELTFPLDDDITFLAPRMPALHDPYGWQVGPIRPLTSTA